MPACGDSVTSPRCPVVRRFAGLARQAPTTPAIVAPDGTSIVSRSELLERSRALAGELLAHARAGDTVVLSLPNSPECVAAFVAARAAGMRVALVDAAAPESELGRCAITVGARVVVSKRVPAGADGTARCCAVTVGAHPGLASATPTTTAVLKLTSGSTGSPQAVALSIRQVAADAVQIIRSMRLRAADRTLAAIPLTHSYGFGSCLMPLLLAGTPLVFPSSNLPAALLAALSGAKVAHFPAVPAMIRALAALPGLPALPHLRVCLSAGALLDPGDAAAFRSRTGVKVHVFYGSSECGGITYDRTDRAVVEKGRVGTPLWRVMVEVVGQDGRPCPPGVEGRVRVSSPAVALGLVPAPQGESPIAARTFSTADLGVLDRSQQLTLTGRVTTALNVAGKKVHPEEVRRTIEALAGVRAAVVVGLPDRHRGDLVAALVAVDRSAGLTESGILAHCRAHLAPHKLPHRLVLVDELPRSDRGKVKREEVVQLLGAPRRRMRR